MTIEKVFIDTSAFYALMDRSDSYHQSAMYFERDRRQRVYNELFTLGDVEEVCTKAWQQRVIEQARARSCEKQPTAFNMNWGLRLVLSLGNTR